MGKRSMWASALLLLAISAAAQTEPVRLKVHAVLIDNDLNQKPVPRLTLVLTRLDVAPIQETTVKTGFDGMAEVTLPVGKYRIATPEPVDFQGKHYNWRLEVVLSGREQTLELSNDNSVTSATVPTLSPSAAGGDLGVLFERLKNSVVTVHAESHNGSGFLVDPAGLIVTNNHVVESSDYLAVQFDQKRKVPARLIAANADKDIAVLWVNPAAFPGATMAPLVLSDASSPVAVGERVFTIGSPFGREKVLTTGVISKVEQDSITSDVSINPGNSGGPLFTLRGQVVGITTASQRSLAKIVPIENARALVGQARQKIVGGSPPSAELLPVEPTEFFPADVLRAVLQQPKLDTKPYSLDAGEFQVTFITPVAGYFLRHENEMDAARKAAKRAGGDPLLAKPPAGVLEEAQEYRPILYVGVQPKLKFIWVRGFRNSFQRLRLLCGGKEVPPIEPGRGTFDLRDERGRTVATTYRGLYAYLPDSISPECGGIQVEIFSEKDPNTPFTTTVEATTINRVWADFEAYRKVSATARTNQ